MPVPQKVTFLVGWASCLPIKDLLTMVQDASLPKVKDVCKVLFFT